VLASALETARLTPPGVRIRRLPPRQAGDPSWAPASPLSRGAEGLAAARDRAWTARPGRATVASIGGNVLEIGGEAARIGGNAASERATVPPVGAILACIGAEASGDRGNAPAFRGKAQLVGGNPPDDPKSGESAACRPG